MTFSKDQEIAIRRIKYGKGPFLLTGPAGSGKSYVIDHIRKEAGHVVTATTGIAAQLVNGRTIHSFCSIHPNFGAVSSNKADQRVRSCRTLIIDEISMASDGLLLNIFQRFAMANHHPKLVMVGDFLQLPPVNGQYAFKSHLWKDVEILALSTSHRQSDTDFINALSDLRVGNFSDRLLALIKERKVSSLPTDCTQLFAYRNSVEEMNNRMLQSLPGQVMCSNWRVYSENAKKDYLDPSRARFPAQLLLKVGARVVMLNNKNDPFHPETPIWVNGSTGIIVRISEKEVEVRLDRGNKTVLVKEEAETIYDGNGKEEFTVTQFPMMLAWALTIHKAQGMTLDRVGVDLRGHFDPGQSYVAISRARTKDGLFLVGDLTEIPVNNEALALCGSPAPIVDLTPDEVANAPKDTFEEFNLYNQERPKKKKKRRF